MALEQILSNFVSVCVCVWGGGGGGIPYFSYTELCCCIAAWIGYGFPRSPGYTIEGLRQREAYVPIVVRFFKFLGI